VRSVYIDIDERGTGQTTWLTDFVNGTLRLKEDEVVIIPNVKSSERD
jgi:hypothetical protein